MCGSPPGGINTVPVPADVYMVFGDEFIYSCLSGYKPEISGMNMATTCRADGTLSLEPLPVCVCKYFTVLLVYMGAKC